MSSYMRKHLAGALAAVAVFATACTSSGSPSASPPVSPSASPSASGSAGTSRYTQLVPVVVACFAQHGLIPAKDLDSRFYRNGHVIRNLYFDEWWRNNDGLPVKVNGAWTHLDDVVLNAAAKGTWPTNICGPLPSPSGA